MRAFFCALTFAVNAVAGVSWGPVLSYTPTYGALVGGSLYRNTEFKDGMDIGLFVLSSFRPDFLIDASFEKHFGETVSLKSSLNISNFFTPYYGEGDNTPSQPLTNFNNLNVAIQTGPRVLLAKHWYLRPVVDYRRRKDWSNSPVFPSEDSVAMAVTVSYEEARRKHQFTYRFMPGSFSSYPGNDAFSQLELDLRYFWSFMPNFILASRLLTTASLGNPTYLFRYSLGGSEVLRGFLMNRFRGKNIAAVQEEFRFPIWRMFSAATFVEAGDISDGVPNAPRLCYGFGMRYGLPPDAIAKLRMDVGFSRDQVGVFFMYGEAF